MFNKLWNLIKSIFVNEDILKLAIQAIITRTVSANVKQKVGWALDKTIINKMWSIEDVRKKALSSIKLSSLLPSEQKIAVAVITRVMDMALASKQVKDITDKYAQLRKFKSILQWASDATKM